MIFDKQSFLIIAAYNQENKNQLLKYEKISFIIKQFKINLYIILYNNNNFKILNIGKQELILNL